MIKYQYFEDNSVLVVKYYGDIRPDEVIDFIEYIYSSKLLKVFSDLTEATLLFSIDESEKIGECWSRIVDHPLRSVLLVNDSNTTAMSLWHANYLQNSSIQTLVCSTYEKAISFLSLKLGPGDMERMIRDLPNIYP